jgi:hypothetical protein
VQGLSFVIADSILTNAFGLHRAASTARAEGHNREPFFNLNAA